MANPVKSTITGQTYSYLLQPSADSLGTKDFRLTIPGKDTVREICNILSPQECTAIIDATCASDEGFSRPTAFSIEARDCERIHTVDTTMSSIIMARLKPYLPEVVKIDRVRWRLSRFTHHWRYVRYFPGGHFTPHYDGVKMSVTPTPCMTVFTVQIYLNGKESFTGGSTRFYPDYQPERSVSHEIEYGHVRKFDPFSKKGFRMNAVEPQTGKALIFNHALNTLHDGSAVVTGTKFIMRGDVLYAALPEDLHLLPSASDSIAASEIYNLHWCPITAEKHGTRNYVGDVWYCVCANDKHGATVDTADDADRSGACWHSEYEANASNESEYAPTTFPLSYQQNPKVLVLLSGKRAVGKDHIANLLKTALSNEGLNVHRTALGNINKRIYAATIGIDVERLLNDRAFKESHRVSMVQHHTQRNLEDPSWCLKTVLNEDAGADVILLSDLRTQEDLTWFQEQAIPIILLRISANNTVRKDRGWDPCSIKDALHTETDLDHYNKWTACWDNSDSTGVGALLLQNWIELTVIPRTLAIILKRVMDD